VVVVVVVEVVTLSFVVVSVLGWRGGHCCSRPGAGSDGVVTIDAIVLMWRGHHRRRPGAGAGGRVVVVIVLG